MCGKPQTLHPPTPTPNLNKYNGSEADEEILCANNVLLTEKEKAWKRRAPSVRCDVAAPAITGAKLLRNGLENVTFNGRQLWTAS